MVPLPFEQMLDPVTLRMKPRKVNVESESFKCAQSYMARVEASDLENPERLKSLAGLTNLNPEQFKARFAPLVPQ